jgi:tryptophan synthase alpha chain
MNRIDKKFIELKKADKKALITFITAGDPDINTTYNLVLEMEKSGADIIELGIPYSDPIAEGPVIQRANLRAFKNNIKIKDVMELVQNLRKVTDVPLLYLMYVNIILQYGADRFFNECAKNGVDALIIPDLPYEEQDELLEYSEKYGVYLISLVSPTSKDRAKKIAQNAKGFLYCVSSLGVTGSRKDFSTDFKEFFSYLEKIKVPKAIGFGISNAEHIKQLKGYCDGLIVGSAIVKIIEQSQKESLYKNISDFVKSLKSGFDN